MSLAQARQTLQQSGAIPTRREKTWIDTTVISGERSANFTTCRELIDHRGRKIRVLTDWERGLVEARKYAAMRAVLGEMA